MLRFHFRNAQRPAGLRQRPYRRAIEGVAARFLPHLLGECCFHWVGPRSMARLNLDHLGHRGPTDVITFSLGEPGAPLQAEAYICPSVARDHAREHGTTLEEEMLRYHIHALLHLDGMDDATREERARMEEREEELLEHARGLGAMPGSG